MSGMWQEDVSTFILFAVDWEHKIINKGQKIRERCLLASSCLPVCLSASMSAAPTGRIFVKIDVGDFVEIWQKEIEHFTRRLKLCFKLSALTRVGQHCSASMATLPIFTALLTGTYVRQQYKWNALLRFHGDSGYSNSSWLYFIRTLPTLFRCSSFLNFILTSVKASVISPKRF